MGRHGYCDDLDQRDLAMWRGRVASAIRGKRGQALLRDLRDALDAMPDKRLITEDLVRDGEVCALGAVAIQRGIPNIGEFDPEDHDALAKLMNVASCLIQEIEYENDEGRWRGTPEQRWDWMRKWCDKNIVEEARRT